MKIKIITDVTLIDGTGEDPVNNAAVLIDREGKIAACGCKDEVYEAVINQSLEVEEISCPGKTLLPGLIDAHVHLCFEPCADPFAVLGKERDARTALKAVRHARQTLLSGVTILRDMGGKNYVDLDLRNALAKGEATGPTMLASGKLITMTGGHGWPVGEEVDGVDQARKGARKQLKEGVDIVKIMATGGVMTEGVETGSPQLTEKEIRAAVEEAHKAGKRTAAHAQGAAGIKNALRAGIDSIEHGMILNEEAVEMMKERGVCLVPTLAAPYCISEKGRDAGVPEYMLEKSDAIRKTHIESFKMACRAGVSIAMGTDAGTPFNYHGQNGFELVLMVEYGMSPLEAVKAGTLQSARLLGISDTTGTVFPGKYADLLILNGDPLADIRNIQNVYRVYQKGVEVS